MSLSKNSELNLNFAIYTNYSALEPEFQNRKNCEQKLPAIRYKIQKNKNFLKVDRLLDIKVILQKKYLNK